MFEYFPGNYVWNLGVVATLNSGGLIDEVDRACRPIRRPPPQGEDAGHAGLPARLDRADRPARRPGRGRPRRPGTPAPPGSCTSAPPTTCARPSGCCRQLRPEPGPDLPAGAGAGAEGVRPARTRGVTRVAIPYEGTTLPAYFSQAPATDDGPAPVIVLVNGLDSTKEHMYASGHWEELAARGISCLMLDQPGTGEALRLQGLTARIDTEAWAGAASTTCETRDDVDAARIGIVGWSLGGYYAPAGRRVREAVRARRRLGRQPQLGRRAAPPPRARGRAAGPALLGARAVGVGLDDRPRRVHRLRRRRPPGRRRRADHRAVPHRARRRTTGRSRSSTRTAPTSRRSTAPSASCGCSRPRRARPSTSAWTTCRTSARSSPTGSPTPSRSRRSPSPAARPRDLLRELDTTAYPSLAPKELGTGHPDPARPRAARRGVVASARHGKGVVASVQVPPPT